MSDEILRLVDGLIEKALREQNLPEALYGMMAYHLGWLDASFQPVPDADRARYGGKKMRALLCVGACEAAGGNPQSAIPSAAAIELVQNFSLMHDDIEDEDRERRHRSTVWVQWGVPQAINTGSAMQALVNAAVLRTDATPDTRLDLLHAITRAMIEMTEGQHLDIAYQNRDDISVSEYADMASRKTGALMEAAAYMGARLATPDPTTLAAWSRFGRAFGEAFQAQDDLLGVVGDPRLTGKPVGNDIRSRKKAMPLVYACSNASADDRSTLSSLLSEDPVSDASVECITSILDRSGALAATRDMVAERTAAALTALDEAHPVGPAASRLREMVLRAVGRRH